jgi:hypothetical protein
MSAMRAAAMRAVAVCALLLASGCGGGPAEEAAPESAPAQTPAFVAPPSRTPLTIAPREGPPGTEVTLTMSGLNSGAADLEIGFGDFTEHEIIGHADADAEGRLSTVIAVPASTPTGTRYFFLAEMSGSPLAVSDSFVVTSGP